MAIHAALCREHGYSGSYPAVGRLLRAIVAALNDYRRSQSANPAGLAARPSASSTAAYCVPPALMQRAELAEQSRFGG